MQLSPNNEHCKAFSSQCTQQYTSLTKQCRFYLVTSNNIKTHWRGRVNSLLYSSSVDKRRLYKDPDNFISITQLHIQTFKKANYSTLFLFLKLN